MNGDYHIFGAVFGCILSAAAIVYVILSKSHKHRFTRERFIRGPKGRFTDKKESYCVDCQEWIPKDD